MSNVRFRKLGLRPIIGGGKKQRSPRCRPVAASRADLTQLRVETLEKRVLLSGTCIDDLLYTHTGSGEKTVEELLEGIYGGGFTSDDGIATGTSRTLYLGGGAEGNVSALRVFDFLACSENGDQSNNDVHPINLITGTPLDVDPIWTDGVATATAQAKFALYSQEFGYDQHDGPLGGRTGYTSWIVVSGNGFAGDGMSAQIVGDAERMFSPTWEWARSGNKPAVPHDVWYSGNNSDGLDHMITYEITGLDNGAEKTWLLFWDDQVAGRTDRDFNDLVVEIQANRTAPEIVVTVEATDPLAAEPDNPGMFTLTRSGGIEGDLDVFFALSGSATNGGDYDQIGSPVTIPDGQASVSITVNPIDDDEPEGLEDIVLTLQNHDRYAVGGTATATVIMGDDDVAGDQPLVLMFANDPIAGEPNDDGRFAVYRLNGVEGDLEVSYAIGGSAGNGTDYGEISNKVTIPDGMEFAEIVIDVRDDSAVEGFEDVVLTLVNNEAYETGFISSATVIIIDNDVDSVLPVVSLLATDAHAAEPADTGRFTLIRTGDITNDLTVNYTIAGSAVNGDDYAEIGTSVTKPARIWVSIISPFTKIFRTSRPALTRAS